MTNEEKFYTAIRFLNMIPFDCHPRIGGSCALWRKGFRDSFDDVDIIVDFLPSPKIAEYAKAEVLELKHKKRLNKTMEFMYQGVHIDIHESLMPRKNNELLEDTDNILHSQKLLKRFFKAVYNEDIDKW